MVPSRRATSGAALAAALAVGCAGHAPRTGGVDPECDCLERTANRELKEAFTEAGFEVARLDARSTDWSVYAHHPNIYVRGLSLVRLRDQAATADEARLRRVVELMADWQPLYDESCIRLMTSCEQGQGPDFGRGGCVRTAKTVRSLADDVLAAAEPHRVVAAMVAHLAQPGLAEITTDGVRMDELLFHRLGEAASKAPRALPDTVAGRLLGANQEARTRLIRALSVAPLGSGDARIVNAVVPSLKAKDEFESTCAAAAILRLTDQPGPSAAPVAGSPRQGAVALLEARFPAGRATSALSSIGPAAAPLLDTVLAHIDRVKADPSFDGNVEEHAVLLGQIGPRAARAARTLLDAAELLAARGERSVDHLPKVLHALGAIGAPPAELKRLVLGHFVNRDVFAAGVGALLTVGAKLSAEELAALKEGEEEHCRIPNHPSAYTGAWDQCFQARNDLEDLEKISRGEPVTPR